jgi:hypothetical protein
MRKSRATLTARIAVTMLAAICLVLGISSLARAGTTPNVCGNGGTGYCLNDWNNAGVGFPVKMNYGHTPNSDFSVFPLTNMCNAGHVSASMECPFTPGSGLNSQMNGAGIFALRHSNGLCVGTTSSTVGALMENCPDVYGNNGGWSTIYAGATNSDCPGSEFYAESRYWSDAYSSLSSLESGGNVGVQAWVSTPNATATCWGWVS